MSDNNPLSAIADSVRELAEGVGRLVKRVVDLESAKGDHETRIKKLESNNGSQASE